MRSMLFVLTLTVFLVSAGTALAQFTQNPNDLGAADTVDIVYTVVPDFTTNQLKLQVDLYVFCDANTLSSATMGYFWDNPNLQMDSAKATPAIVTAFDLGRFFFEDDNLATTNANQRFLFGGVALFSPGLAPSPTRQHWASYYLTFSDWQACDSVLIDSLTFNGGSELLLVTEAALDYKPFYEGPGKYKDTACAAPSNIVLSTDSLYFTGVEGSGTPSAQLLQINSDNDPLAFTLVETMSWVSLSPVLGTTPRTITVLPNIIGLSAGVYVDSIQVNAPAAANTPQYVKVVFEVVEPPAVIGVTPTEFFFNAVAGGSNPAPKILTIENEGGSTLNWTVANSQPWLSLVPGAGVDSGDVTLSVDITGLAFGVYYDTIVVNDPLAANSPKPVPVTLSVGSDLPIIAVDSAFNYVVVPSNKDATVGPWTLVIRNDGAGTMNFTTTENAERILSVVPSAGTAPQSVQVNFKLTSGSAGNDYIDTLWIHSNEAINSPFPVVFLFHYVQDPAQMLVTADTLRVTLYECEMGTKALLPTAGFFVTNVGGDDPLNFQIFHESDLYELQYLSLTAPASVSITANFLDLPIGVYLDTIVIYAQKAVNPVDTVIVKYSVIAGVQQPKIWVSAYSHVVPSQENQGPLPNISFAIRNENGGCMPWHLHEEVPWIFPADTMGLNPFDVDLGVNPDGYLFGEYLDSFYVYAETASNSPGQIRLRLQIWRFHGDNDWNARINVVDLTYLVQYLFLGGPEPIPIRHVGDMTCNRLVNIEDLTYLVNYLFKNGPIACGNPYK